MQSMIPITDDNDLIIGYKAPIELKPTDIYRVARLLIISSQDQLLMAQRAFTKAKDPWLWGLAVEGTVEKDETYESNIRKEAEEEIGLTLGQLTLGPKLRMTGKYNHHCQFFIYRADLDLAQLTLQAEELAVVSWFDKATLLEETRVHSETFGYRFEFILRTALPYL